jgi:hypothetical protein
MFISIWLLRSKILALYCPKVTSQYNGIESDLLNSYRYHVRGRPILELTLALGRVSRSDETRRDDAGLAPLIVISTQVKYTTISSLTGDVADHHPLLPLMVILSYKQKSLSPSSATISG